MALLNFDGIFNNSNPTNVQLDLYATNNNNGTTYQSAELNVARQLALDIQALPGNSGKTLDEITSDWGVSLSGEVQNGWNSNVNADGSISLTQAPFGVDAWNNTNADSTQDMQFYTINIPKSQLELDGLAGYNPLTDARIELSGAGNTISDGFVGVDGVNSFPVVSQQYTAVPEPTSLILMGSVVAAYAMSKIGKLGRKK